MDDVYNVLAKFVDVTSGGDSEVSHSLRNMQCSQALRPHRFLDALLNLIQTLNKAALRMTVETQDSISQPTPAEDALLQVISDYVVKSDEQLNRALDELLKRQDIFTSKHIKESSRVLIDEASKVLADSVPRKPSALYTPRNPRLPGLPEPPPDQFGEWDEYRDDLDPGYRVRDVYEYDYFRETDTASQPSTAATLGAREESDELNQVVGGSSSVEPSPIPTALDELDMATSSACAAPIIDIDSEGNRSVSPAFGASVEDCKDTLKYDYMGQSVRVPRRVAAPVDTSFPPPSQPHPPCTAPSTLSSYPLTVTQSDKTQIILDELLLPVIRQRMRTGFEATKEFDTTPGTIVAGRYKIVSFLGSAAFSKAVKAIDLLHNSDSSEVCLKIIKNDKDFFDQSLDEIQILNFLKSEALGTLSEKRILTLKNFLYTKEHLILVTELLRDNLYEFSKFNRDAKNNEIPFFTIGRIQKIAHQILTALSFIHSKNIIHCDLKPENILFKSYAASEIRVIDFGSSCFNSDRLASYVQSRCYRAPEIILGCGTYSSKIDMWSLGCILAELWTGTVLFQNDSTHSLLARVAGIIGRFPDHMIQSGRNVDQFFINRESQQLFVEIDSHTVVPAKGRLVQLLVPKKTSLYQRMRIDDANFLDFLAQLLQIDPDLRISADQALQHPWIAQTKYSDGI